MYGQPLTARRPGGPILATPRFVRRRESPARRSAVTAPTSCARLHRGELPDRVSAASEEGNMEVLASAPGKVLIAGGYLVLERPNADLVLSTTARFYAVVRPLRDGVAPDSWAWAWTDVKVTSPQLSREATYKLSLKKSTLQLTSAKRAIQFSLAAAKATITDKDKKDVLDKLLLQGLDITILGCNYFYSYRKQIEAQGLPLTPELLLSLPPFSSITFNSEVANGTMTGEKYKPEVAKTGLGSSAAMTMSVVAALLHYLGAVNLSCLGQSSSDSATGRHLDLVHAIAQSAHCIACETTVITSFHLSSSHVTLILTSCIFEKLWND